MRRLPVDKMTMTKGKTIQVITTTILNEPDIESWEDFCYLIKQEFGDLDQEMIYIHGLFGVRIKQSKVIEDKKRY